jgi:hypothetical protein
MTPSALVVLFVLPLSLLVLGGLALLLQRRSDVEITDMVKPPTITVSAEVEARLAELLELSPNAGAALPIHNTSGRVIGVLLTRDEYELLNVVAAAARFSDSTYADEQSEKRFVSYEEAFDSRSG